MNHTAGQTVQSAAASTEVGSRIWRKLNSVADADPGRSAVEEFGPGLRRRRWSYEELRMLSVSLAGVLGERLEPGAIVVLDGPGGARQVAWMLAAIRARLWVLPAPMQTTRDELAALWRRTGAAAIIGPVRHLEACEWIDWETPARTDPAHSCTDPPGGIILVTSGTTGEKKFVERDSNALDADAANVLVGVALRPDDRVLLTLSLSHSYGIDLVLGGLLAGATLELVRDFDLAVITRRLAGGATVFPGMPFLFEGLTPRWEGSGALRLAFSAGSRMPETTRRAFEIAAGLPIGDLYGSTELGTVLFRDPSRTGHEPGLVGSPLPGVSVRILSSRERGRTLGPGDEGELAIRAPSMLRGYLDAPASLVDDHFPTGDLARVDTLGRVFLTGRIKFLLQSGGHKLNPVELEQLIESHPKVLECLVVAMPLSDTISRLKALIVPRQPDCPPTSADLRAFLQDKIASAKIPRRFEVVAALPKSVSGKVLRTEPGEGSR